MMMAPSMMMKDAFTEGGVISANFATLRAKRTLAFAATSQSKTVTTQKDSSIRIDVSADSCSMAEGKQFFGVYQDEGGVKVAHLQREDDDKSSVDVLSPDFNSAVSQTPINQRVPKRILHFSDGTLEEYSSDEDDVDSSENLVDSRALIDPQSLTWGPYLWYCATKVGSTTLSVCDYLGEHLASFFGITSPKYQLEINEYFRMKAQEEEERNNRDLEMRGWNSKDEIALVSNCSGKETVATQPPSVEYVKERY